MKCENCGNDFESKRATAKYCSARCRVSAGRGLSVTDDSLSVTVSVTDTPLSVTQPALSVTDVTVKPVSVTRLPDVLDGAVGVEGMPPQQIKALLDDKNSWYNKARVTEQTNKPTVSEAAKTVNAMTTEQVKAVLDDWHAGKGTAYQHQLAVLGRQYGTTSERFGSIGG